MSRYINAEWLLNFFEPYPTDYQTPLGLLRACVDDASTIDAVEVVRCKECKHWHDHITTTWCSRGAELRPQESGWVKRDADDFIDAWNKRSADRPQGEWIWVEHPVFERCKCSLCGYCRQLKIPEPDKFCPNCGAKMKGAEE